MARSLQELTFRLAPVRWSLAFLALCGGASFLALGDRHRAYGAFCWIVRVSNVAPAVWMAQRLIFTALAGMHRTRENPILQAYLSSHESSRRAASLTLFGGDRDLFRDVIVLKRWTPDENGVILLKYGQTFDGLAAAFDLERLRERYTFVLEPCWTGYCDPSILMLMSPGHPLVVQCFTGEDHSFIDSIGGWVVPVRLGPADWVDADLFVPPPVEEKPYDLVMVANWARHKRHALLFSSLKTITSRRIRVLLIGFPWGGRTLDDIRREAESYKSALVEVDIMERLPANEVATQVARCKVFVFLSRKEGDNKALVEAMFANVPAIVHDKSVGGARSRLTPSTGILAGDDELADKILYMLDHRSAFTPRDWALAHTGSAIATSKLNEALERAVTRAGGRYIEPIAQKVNAPNLAYKDPLARSRFEADYDFILANRRHGVVVGPREAVA